MPSLSIVLTGSIGGVSISGSTSRSGESQVSHQTAALTAAAAGTLSTRTSDTAGTLTLSAGHGITQDDTIDIFWTDATTGLIKCCYGANADTVTTGNTVDFSGGAGDVLPTQGSSITVDVVTEITDATFDGDNLQLILQEITRTGKIVFLDSGSAVLDHWTAQAAEARLWVYGHGANPLTGNAVDTIRVSNGDSSNTAVFKLGALLDTIA